MTKLIAYVKTDNSELKLWKEDNSKFHATYKEEYDNLDDFDIVCTTFSTAYYFFTTEVKRRGYENVMVCEDFNDYFPSYDEYEEDCEMEYEKDYGPSNPWDAPGMKISDFIKGVY